MKPSEFLSRHAAAVKVIFDGIPVITHSEPLELPPVSNGSQGVSMAALKARSGRKAKHYAFGGRAGDAFRAAITGEVRNRIGDQVRLRASFVVVRLVREAPRPLDDDNLASAFKAVRDGIADALGLNDRDQRVRFVVDEWAGSPPRVWAALYAGDRAADALTLPPPRVRAKKPRTKKAKAPPEGIDVKWWQRAPVPNICRPPRR